MTDERRHRRLMQQLMGEIVAGRFEVGELLPKEEDVASRFEVSRGVARECVRGLEERRVVAVRHGSGARVRPETDWGRFDADVLMALLKGSRAADVLGECLECRRMLEVEAAGLAGERATDEAVERLSRAYAEMRATAKSAQEDAEAEELYHKADIAFHRAIVHATGNPTLGQVTEPIHRALATTFSALARPKKRFERGLPEHERILDAIAHRDADQARQAMQEHLLTVEGYLREYAERRRWRAGGTPARAAG